MQCFTETDFGTDETNLEVLVKSTSALCSQMKVFKEKYVLYVLWNTEETQLCFEVLGLLSWIWICSGCNEILRLKRDSGETHRKLKIILRCMCWYVCGVHLCCIISVHKCCPSWERNPTKVPLIARVHCKTNLAKIYFRWFNNIASSICMLMQPWIPPTVLEGACKYQHC